ncbi:unnamed protein product [Pylaiella littoralis]
MLLLGRLLLLPSIWAWAGLRQAQGYGDEMMLDNPITIEPRTGNIYDTKPKLKIKGSGFGQFSAEDLLQLKFDPPMAHGDVLAQATVKSEDIVLELAPGKIWPQSEGVLKLVEAFFGQEPLVTTPITVATVIPTPTVYPANDILFLTSTRHLMINGTNFNLKKTGLFFSPPLSYDTDITILVDSPTLILVLLVAKGGGIAKWADEPGPLKLVAIDTGAGNMLLREDLGGVTIAEMQADTKGHSISVENHEEVSMYQSTKVLTIAGIGFNPDNTKFRFGNTALLEGKNYTATGITPYSATISLTEGSKWRLNDEALPGPLLLLAADSGDGFVPLGSTNAKAGRKVATVYEDPKLEESHTEIGRTLTHELNLKGSGFTKVFPPMIIFDPAIQREDYVVQVMNRTSVKLTLAGAGRGWLPEGKTGGLSVTSINTGGGMFHFKNPVPVATVVADDDPHHTGINFKPNYVAQLYQSSNLPLVIEGEGFPVDTPAKLEFAFGGPSEESFSSKTVSDTKLEVTLAEGHTWADKGGPLILRKATFGEVEVSSSFSIVESPSSGLVVATVLDDPFISASQLHVYASHTKHITIQGSGFISAFDIHKKPKLELSPTMSADFWIKDGEWTDETVTISLAPEPGAKWADVRVEGETTAIKVTSVDTGAGSVAMPAGGIVIAQVQMDDATFSCEDSCLYANDGECDELQDESASLNWVGYMSESNSKYVDIQAASASKERPGSRGDLGDVSASQASDDLAARVPSCPMGTDCTDCGFPLVELGTCTNTCQYYPRDGVCDDRRGQGVCADGTDCQDCGPWGQSNFTQGESASSSPEESINTDDSSFLASKNHPKLKGQEGNALGPFKRVFTKHEAIRKELDQAEGLFMESLYAAIVLVGGSVFVYLVVLVMRFAKGERISIPIPTNPDVDDHRR